jgi:DNA-binding transcriptional ArsR family regulator
LSVPRPVAHEDVFRAVADPTRRAILEALSEAPELSVTALATPLGVSVPALSRHLAVLRRAGLVEERAAGRHRMYRLRAAPLADLYDWAGLFRGFWPDRLAGLDRYLSRKSREAIESSNGESDGA